MRIYIAFLATRFYEQIQLKLTKDSGSESGKVYASALCNDTNYSHTLLNASHICQWANASLYNNISCYDTIKNYGAFNLTNACDAQSKNEENSFKFSIGQCSSYVVSIL